MFTMLGFALPTALAAQGVELTPFAGFRGGGNFEVLGAAPDLQFPDAHLDGALHYGLLLDIPIGLPNVRLELSWSRQSAELDLDDVFSSPRLFDVDVDHLQVGFLYQWERGDLRPFFVGAVGVSQLDPDAPGLTTSSHGSLSLGGGTKFMVSPRFGFRLEGRIYGINTGDSQTFCDRDGCLLDSPSFLWQYEATAGLVFAF